VPLNFGHHIAQAQQRSKQNREATTTLRFFVDPANERCSASSAWLAPPKPRRSELPKGPESGQSPTVSVHFLQNVVLLCTPVPLGTDLILGILSIDLCHHLCLFVCHASNHEHNKRDKVPGAYPLGVPPPKGYCSPSIVPLIRSPCNVAGSRRGECRAATSPDTFEI